VKWENNGFYRVKKYFPYQNCVHKIDVKVNIMSFDTTGSLEIEKGKIKRKFSLKTQKTSSHTNLI